VTGGEADDWLIDGEQLVSKSSSIKLNNWIDGKKPNVVAEGEKAFKSFFLSNFVRNLSFLGRNVSLVDSN
jgi:hypothetical protein